MVSCHRSRRPTLIVPQAQTLDLRNSDDTVGSRDQVDFLEHLKRKAGLPGRYWSESLRV